MRILSCVLLAATLVWASGCSDDDESAPGTLEIHFDHVVSGADLQFDSMIYTNAAGNSYSVEKLQYYVSDVRATRTSGKPRTLPTSASPLGHPDAQFPGAHYRDARELETRTLTMDSVPGGTYTSLSFVFGLGSGLNVPDGLPATLENINMQWPPPLGGGYHYMKWEGKYQEPGGSEDFNYATHMGRIDNDAVADEHHFFSVDLALPEPVRIDGNTAEITVVMDLNQFYEDPNVYTFPEVPMIMNRPEVQTMLQANGATVFSIGGGS